MLAKRVTVLVRRDMAEAIPATVFEHEVDILRDIHGAGNIEVLDAEFPDEELDAEDEFGRLKMYYGQNDQGAFYVERIHGVSSRALEAFDVTPKRGRRKAEDEV